ncbi:MAG: pitrilysin family protein, partial [Planctomycetota bacterium]
VEELDAAAVQSAAQKYLVRNNRTVGLFIPSETADRVTIPDSTDFIARLEGYKGREVVQAGENFDPSPANIEDRTLRGEMAPGLQFALLPKSTRGETVSMLLTLRFGTPETLVDRRAAAELLGTVMSRGTESMDYQTLQDELTRLRAEMSVSTTPGLLQVTVKTKRENVSEVLELVGDVLRHPELSQKEFDAVKLQLITGLQQRLSDPTALAVRAVQRATSPYGSDDIRYVQTLEEEIEMYESVELGELRSLHEELLSGQRGELAAVGAFDPDSLKSEVLGMLAGWKSDTEYVRVDRPANVRAEGELSEINVPDKANAFFFSTMQMELPDTAPEFAPLVLGNFIFGGGSLSSRLGNRVRQQEGLSYTVRSSLGPRPKDGRSDFVVYAITNPENKDKLMAVIREEFEKLREDGVTEEELEKAKTAYLQGERVRRTNDGALAGELVQSLFLDRTMKFDQEFEDRIQSATVESVNQAIRSYLSWEAMEKAVAGDFEKAAETGESP